jgi:putative molybdopterin biosynthesis protein
MALADGYVDIPKNQEFLEEGDEVQVKLFSPNVQLADLLIIGSHCTGIDLILQHMRIRMPNLVFKVVNIGSMGGLNSVLRGEADISGVHILDENTSEYNIEQLRRQKLFDQVSLIRGYSREQGFIVTKGNTKGITSLSDLLRDDIVFLNRNPGSGTRILIDFKLKVLAKSMNLSFNGIKKKIAGYNVEAKSHQAIAASIAQGKADVGIGIKTVAHFYNLDFIHLDDEMYDFLIPSNRAEKKAVKLFFSTLNSKEFKKDLSKKMPGLKPSSLTGRVMDK